METRFANFGEIGEEAEKAKGSQLSQSFEDSEESQSEVDKGIETDKTFSLSDNQNWAIIIEFRAQI